MEEHLKQTVNLTESDTERILQITAGVDVVPEEIRMRASSDVIDSIAKGHPLNKIWRNDSGEITGYLVFDDFAPNEAYVKYLGTDGLDNENPFVLVPSIIQEAKSLGYKKIHFHGWNQRLNKVLEHFGFHKVRIDHLGEYSADYFEINLVDEGRATEIEKQSFEKKYISHLIKEVDKTLKTLDEKQKQAVVESEAELTRKLSALSDFVLDDKRKVILKLKLARYFQRHDSVDTNTLFDAIIETPKFLDKDKGGFDRLLELHEQKTLLKIAELRKKKAEQTDEDGFNPFEALFETSSGKYYVARLLNMPHLEEESEYMGHCVGTSDSYINKMKSGDVEILSFRLKPQLNRETQKLEGGEPIVTIEYNIRTKTIEQIKKANDEYLKQDDPFYADFIDALKQLRSTMTDAGESRDFKEINASELEHIQVKDYFLLTENGEVSFRDYYPDSDVFVLKRGRMDITLGLPPEDRVKIFKIVTGIDVLPEQIALRAKDLNKKSIVYIGPWNP